MGTYNRLQSQQRCPVCGHEQIFYIQFKYGHVRLIDYQVGDTLEWRKPQVGTPGVRRVVVDGVVEYCPNCGAEGSIYEVWVEQDRIVEVRPASGNIDFLGAQETFIVVES